MIPTPVLASWAQDHPWPSDDQVEQDLLIAQAMAEISHDALLGETLALRGGYERRKGRDLFDLWLAIREFDIDLALFAKAFELYRPKGVDGEKLATNLRDKLESVDYRTDCDLLIRGGAESVRFSPYEAAEIVERELLSRI